MNVEYKEDLEKVYKKEDGYMISEKVVNDNVYFDIMKNQETIQQCYRQLTPFEKRLLNMEITDDK